MSLVYSNTTTKSGIIQRIERKLFGSNGDGTISGNTTLLAQFTGDVNVAMDRAFTVIFDADGRWQFDDANHTDYPIIRTNLVSGQRDYTFTADSNSNLILGIEKIAILPSATATEYQEIYPVDANSDGDSPFVVDNTGDTGVPTQYDKLGNGIFLEPIPNYNATNGLKIYISREASYFATSDTTKKPGFAGVFHEYLVLHVCYNYARDNNLATMALFERDMIKMEKEMQEYYGKRAADERQIMTHKPILYI